MSPLRSPASASPRPTLRQRVAALRAGLARTKGPAADSAPDPAPEPTPVTLAREAAPDPIPALIAAHVEARAALNAAAPGTDTVGLERRGEDTSAEAMAPRWAAWNAANADETQAWNAVCAARPTTFAGALAQLRHFARWAPENEGQDGTISMSEALAGLADGLAGVLNHHPEGADAELIRLGRLFGAAQAHAIATMNDWTERETAANAVLPPRPAVLTFRSADNQFNLRRMHEHPDATEGSPVTADDIAWMRRRPRTHQIVRDARPGEHGWRDFGGRVPEVVPWPEAQARADELTAAWDAWQADIQGVFDAHGVEAAGTAHDAAEAIVLNLCDRVAALPATTGEGLRIKLRASAYYEDDHNAQYPAGRLLNSLLRDAKRRHDTDKLAPVDWRSPPPGFMASPAIEPTNFARIPEAIGIEVARLHGIALAEFERRAEAAASAGMTEHLRRELRLDALTAAVHLDALADPRLSDDRAWAIEQAAAVDLSGCTILQLHNLYGRFTSVADRWLDLSCVAWTQHDARSPLADPNAAGRIVDREHERATEIRTRIADEMGRRPVPADRPDRDWHLETLIAWELACNMDLRHAPELRARIAAEWGA